MAIAIDRRDQEAPTMVASDTVNVTRLIDDGPITRAQVTAMVLCALVAFLDGLDSQSIAVAAPIMAEQMKLARSALGPIFSSALLGAAIGAFTFGPLADRFGRKSMLIAATLIFGAFTLLTAYADSYPTLLLVRFAAGIGLGGATPCFLALASEYAPKRRRAMVASVLFAAFPLGGIIGAFANAYILTHSRWQMIFVVGGVLPFVVAAALAVWLPESIRFLLASGRHAERLGAIVRTIRPGVGSNARFVADEERIAGLSLKHLFADGRGGATVLLWVAFFTSFAVLAMLVVWTPLLMRDAGLAPAQASIAIGISGIGGLIGIASAGRLVERFGSAFTLVPALILGAVATAALGHYAGSLPAVSTIMFFIALFIGTGSSGSIALAALAYPTAVRSSGIGWAMGMGRFGQLLAPLAAAGMTAAGTSGSGIFNALGVVALIGAFAILGLPRTPR